MFESGLVLRHLKNQYTPSLQAFLVPVIWNFSRSEAVTCNETGSSSVSTSNVQLYKVHHHLSLLLLSLPPYEHFAIMYVCALAPVSYDLHLDSQSLFSSVTPSSGHSFTSTTLPSPPIHLLQVPPYLIVFLLFQPGRVHWPYAGPELGSWGWGGDAHHLCCTLHGLREHQLQSVAPDGPGHLSLFRQCAFEHSCMLRVPPHTFFKPSQTVTSQSRSWAETRMGFSTFPGQTSCVQGNVNNP